ncbi:hypothetical protein F4810DRAFT_704644 [Camillea tinctor]|nr:hypothetical protein F4810DRAFT_704644 [Camillea tinctor]
MSSSSTPEAPAPWRALFLEHISSMPSPEFVLSTVRQVPLSSSSPQHTSYAPRARTCVFRGLWAELPVNPKNEGPLNPARVYASDLPTFTTDARMGKVEELWGGWEGGGKGEGVKGVKGEGEGPEKGSGGGGPVEAIWWAPGPKVQWRIRGPAYLLALDDVEGSEAEKRVRARMRGFSPASAHPRRESGSEGAEEGKKWTFPREVAAHFANLSPAMRGSFRNPPPGTPVDAPLGDGRLRLGQRVTAPLAEDELARANFRVVVILPREVDRCDLSDPERARRWVYRFLEGEGRWEVVEVWP